MWEVVGDPAQTSKSLKTLRFLWLFWTVGGDGGSLPKPNNHCKPCDLYNLLVGEESRGASALPENREKTLRILYFYSSFVETRGDGGPCPTPQIIERIQIFTVFGEVGSHGESQSNPESLKTL